MSKHRRNQKIGRAAQKLSSASSRLISILSNDHGQVSCLGDALMEIGGALEELGLPNGLPGMEHPAFCNLVSRSNLRHHLIALEGESNE